MSGNRTDHLVEVERLWRAIRRDFFVSVEMFAGARAEPDAHRKAEKGWQRLRENWDSLCQLDIDIAMAIAHGVEQVETMFSKPGDPTGPAAHHLRRLDEVVGVAEIGRKANPDAKVETVGELVSLGEDAIQREIEDDLGT